jgi:parallel beta-helix repeat protein
VHVEYSEEIFSGHSHGGAQMRRAFRHDVRLILLAAVLVLALLRPAAADLSAPDSLVERHYILIDEDADFEDPVVSGVSSGTGTEEDPYIIEDWLIDGSSIPWSAGVGIGIGNTTVHFIIRNVWVRNGSAYDEGVEFDTAVNGKIEHCRITDIPFWAGIYLSDSTSHTEISNTLISLGTTSGGKTGIYVGEGCDSNLIRDNYIEVSDYYGSFGIYLYLATDNTITRDTLVCTGSPEGNAGHGIVVHSSHWNTFSENVASGNDDCGIYIRETSSCNLVLGNVFSDNGQAHQAMVRGIGIYIQNASHNTISRNHAHNNYWTGIRLTVDTDSNLIYDNNMMNGVGKNAYDEGSNFWYVEPTGGPNIVGGDSIGGNHYDDYVGVDLDGNGLGEVPYVILGGANFDLYPLIDPILAGNREAEPLDTLCGLEGCNPNPFRSETTVRYWLHRPEYVDLAVFDLQGRKVVELVSGMRPAGGHSVQWTGCDGRGKRVSPGVYFLHMDTAGSTGCEKILLLK